MNISVIKKMKTAICFFKTISGDLEQNSCNIDLE